MECSVPDRTRRALSNAIFTNYESMKIKETGRKI